MRHELKMELKMNETFNERYIFTKIFFHMYIQVFFSLLFLSSLVFFTLTTLALLPLTIPATSIFLTSGLKSFKGMFNKPFPLPTVSLDFFCVSFFGGCDYPPIIAILLSSFHDLFSISVALSFLRGNHRHFTGF